ncbi:beta-glucosidase BglX [Filimonas effusa]|uniref:beta-glucosidase n=1 Tax=Filimonas effusa TaxID=2508721 RepID=A0A4Q1D807_9BACT|nr:beta-glucosidase BglX [Filimonas effusa]RXK83901.1 beta-glucosidase BglX [Filimonas effusa]
MKLLTNLLLALVVSTSSYAQSYDPVILKKVNTLLAKMTLEEKIGQLNQYSGRQVTGPVNEQNKTQKADISSGMVGSMLNVKGAKDTREVQEMALQSRLKIPLLFGLDVIHGYKTVFPIPLGETASWDMQLLEQAAHIAAKEAAACGIHWTFAPMVDIAKDPRWGRIMEGAGEDTYLGVLAAKARVRGFQGARLGGTDAIMACAKHFAAYGAAIAGRDYNAVDMSEVQLWQDYLPPFHAAVEAGVATFMNSFNSLNGVPATGNAYLQRDILKGKWKFNGFVVSDWGSIGEMTHHGFAENDTIAALQAITAGSDMDMESKAYINGLALLVKQKKVDVALIDDAVRRILYKKYELGLFDDPFKFSDPAREQRVLNDPSHAAIARKVAERSIVLLKNENKTLPITTAAKTIALIGPLSKSKLDMAGGWAVQPVDTTIFVNIYDGLKNNASGASILTAKGCAIKGNDRSGFEEALGIARQADIVVMAIGETFTMSGEAKSRSNIGVPGVQQQLLAAIKATGKPVVAVVMAGRPLIMDTVNAQADAIVYAWWLGSEAGNAISNVLFGKYNPSGKLPVTFPRNLGQIPITYKQTSTGRPVLPNGDITYRSAYIDVVNTPQYAFGYGLSYTTFGYSNLQFSKTSFSGNDSVKVSFVITNTGNVAGEEVTQCYIRDKVASIVRPLKELVGYQKLMLQPGESKTISFTLDKNKLAFYNSNLKLITEPGEFDVMIGGASDNTPLKGTINYK